MEKTRKFLFKMLENLEFIIDDEYLNNQVICLTFE